MIGKFICGLLGLWLAGPFGLIAGIIIGHFFDRGLAQQLKMGAFGAQNTEAQQAFFKTTFQVMGHIAKSDGVVTEDELEQARGIMRQLNLTETQKQAAITAFTEGKQAGFNLDAAMNLLLQKCRGQRFLLQLFIEFQVRAATINGQLDSRKEKIITGLSERLGFLQQNNFNFEQFFRSFNEHAQQSSYQGGGNPHKKQMPLDSAYQTLEVRSSATNEEVKKAYRKLISQNHPDKLVSKGLPPEMIKLATEKTQQIQLAYERICVSRGIK